MTQYMKRYPLSQHAPRKRWFAAPIVLAVCSACGGDVSSPDVGDQGSTDTGASRSSEVGQTLAPTATTQGPGMSSPVAPGSTSGESTSSAPTTTDGSTQTADKCVEPTPGRSPLRRLTRFEYSNSLEALLNDTQKRGQQLPAELLGNGFANDADAQPTSPFLIEQYANLAAAAAEAALASKEVLSTYGGCIDTATEQNEDACFQGFIAQFAPRAYRRPVQSNELVELTSLQQTLREYGDFHSSVRGVVEAMLQSSDFLYRLEFGEADAQGRRRPTGAEMANRLSYFLWGAPPDEELAQLAASGGLRDAESVRTQAERLLEHPKARKSIQFFFENYLPINALSEQTRSSEQYPEFNPQIGSLMYEETWRFLEHEIFDGAGTWDAILTAPYTFANERLAAYYGIDGVVGDEFRKVELDTSKRLGLLTQGAIMTGTTVTNYTNPVRRGHFILKHILCVDVPPPPAELASRATPPEPYTGSTGRERYTKHSQDVVCATCHALLDPPGFGLENFDAVGQWRDTENDVTIDARANLRMIGEFNGPVELARAIADNASTHSCFASEWQSFAYGRGLDAKDVCNRSKLDTAFNASGHDVRQLLLDITQTDGFLYLGENE